jgi:2-polyprenyl-6-methoxyphenol hydroxylase-like FAD-dependent oxidoreductase
VRRITIVGGGLAGLTLGIALRRNEVPVTLIEAGRYPRHRVCGEFISGAGSKALSELGLGPNLAASAKPATHSAFFTVKRFMAKHRLPSPAITISRFHLDAALAEEFRKTGGELEAGKRWSWSSFGEGIVCALGRRAQPIENGWRWFGLKVHARGADLEADLEMHIARDSYVGLCQLASGEVNICGLFRRKINQPAQGESMNWLRGERDSLLFQRLEGAEFDTESFCAVAGLSLRPQRIDGSECRIGDALTMIPPITGNGMSMAFESARVAMAPIVAYARGHAEWSDTTATIATALQRQFGRRLRWASLFHCVLFSRFSLPTLRLFGLKPCWRAAFAATR